MVLNNFVISKTMAKDCLKARRFKKHSELLIFLNKVYSTA